MKAITTIFESILRDNNDLVWSPEDIDAATGVCSAQIWGWGG
jgi:hypothetical protein